MKQDYDAQQAISALRQKQYSDQAQYQAPQGRMAGRRYVAPHALEYIGSALRSLGGMRGQGIAEDELKTIQKERQSAIAEALRNFSQAAQGVPGVAGSQEVTGNNPSAYVPAVEGRAAVAPDMNRAYQYLLDSPDAAHRQAGVAGIANIPIQEDKKAQFREQLESKREMAQAQRDFQQQMARQAYADRVAMAQMSAANRPERQAQIIQTDSGPMQLVDGKAVPIMGSDGKPLPPQKNGPARLSATAQKELFEADDAVQNGLGAVSSIQKALDLNKEAYSGVGALTRAAITSNLPWGGSKSADATVVMDNIIKEQALSSMKSIFGPNPTEGERKVLIELQASANKTPEQREEILGRALKAVNRRTEFNKKKSAGLRSGSYMTEGFEASPTGDGMPSADEIAAEIARRRGGK